MIEFILFEKILDHKAMKTLFGLIISILLGTAALGQQYKIENASQRINNKKYEGVSSLVDAELDKVEAFWLDYVKDHGKARRKRNYYQLTEFQVEDLAVDTLTYVTRVEASNGQSLIWLAPFTQDLEANDLSSLNNDIEKILKAATRGYYVSEVQAKIDEAEAAAVAVSKNHQKLIYEGEKLSEDLTGANELKTDLETRLQETDLKIKVLNQQIIDNKLAVDSVYADLEKVKKVIEAHKESMKKIK